MAILLNADGTQKKVQPANGKDFSLQELQQFVGGLIQVVEASLGGRVLVINEEGKLHNLPFNLAASSMYKYSNEDVLVGDVLLCNEEEVQ